MALGFVELPDGTLINHAAIFRLGPPEKSNRVEYVNGSSHTLNDEDGEVLRGILKPSAKAAPETVSEKPKTRKRGAPKEARA